MGISTSKNVKFVVHVPVTHADAVRDAMGKAGAGVIGNYDFCGFSVSGQGRFRPRAGANPFVGELGVLETVEEESIEVTCPSGSVRDLLGAVSKVHPYEEVPYYLCPLLEVDASSS